MTISASTILITGGTGLIGTALTQHFLTQNCQIILLTRHPQAIKQKYVNQQVTIISQLTDIPQTQNIDYVINLAGESVGGGLWTKKRKQKLIDSRINTTNTLVQWLQTKGSKPKCTISGSAVGYYGIDTTHQWQTQDETSPAQNIFMSELCQKWENVIAPLKQLGFNTKIIRLAVVFSKKAPALKQMLLPIKLNTFGKIASGKQPICWIHMDDVIHAIEYILETPTTYDIYNLCAPDHTTQEEFVKNACQLMHKIAPLPLPECLLNLTLQEQAQLVTNGQFVQPKNLLNSGYRFKYTNLKDALNQILTEDVR